MPEPSLRDPSTGQVVKIQGVDGHEIEIDHEPRVPVLDTPGKAGDSVQHLGRKSRRLRVRRGASLPTPLPPSVTGIPGIVVLSGTQVSGVGQVRLAEVTIGAVQTRQVVSRAFAAVTVAGLQSVQVVSVSSVSVTVT